MHVADSKNSRGPGSDNHAFDSGCRARAGHAKKHFTRDGADAQCESMGFKVSVTVADRAGLPIVMLRGDGAGLHTPEGAERKACTARTFSQPSADFVKRLTERLGSRQYTRVLALAGGLPIKAGSEVVGAVGVSGSPGKDDVGSQAGIDKVADQLK